MKKAEKVPEEAEYYYRKAINAPFSENPERTLEYFDRAIIAHSGYAIAWNEKANFLDYLGRCEEAIECYNRAIKLDPELSESYFNKGMTLKKMGKINEAAHCIRYGIKLSLPGKRILAK
ncbi:MAG: tetratricopeptide repeat protein [Methanoregulaceae archaeon]|nr:tetratricopeptide repeat protein [Methanoregulaceae archaeon]